MKKLIDLDCRHKITEIARPVRARYVALQGKHIGEVSGVVEFCESIGGGMRMVETSGVLDANYAKGLLSGQERTGVLDGLRIRRLTPRECWRLQGFSDEQFDKAKAAGVSDSQLYKQAGNAISVNIAYAIGLMFKEVENE